MDLLVVRNEDGTVKGKVYQKKTHTEQYLNYNSHHPVHQKVGVVTTLLDRAHALTSNPEDIATEYNKIETSLNKCNYPTWMIKKAKQQIHNKHPERKQTTKKEEKKKTVVIPYIKGISEAARRIFKKYNIETAMKPHCTIKNVLVHPKDKIEQMRTSSVVYSVPCKDCNEVYIGQTGRPLGNRIGEHKKEVEDIQNTIRTRQDRKDLENNIFKSAITDHAVHKNHSIDWHSVSIKDRENNSTRRIIKESIHISTQQASMNRDSGGYKLPSVYLQVLHKTAPSSGNTKGQARILNSNCNSSEEGHSIKRPKQSA